MEILQSMQAYLLFRRRVKIMNTLASILRTSEMNFGKFQGRIGDEVYLSHTRNDL